MGAEEDVRAGKLVEALADLQDRVRKKPADPKARIFLFQLLAVMGQWDRALTQLGVLEDLDATTVAMVKTYREVLLCEALRTQVFNGERTPLLFGRPSEWMAHLLQALKLGHEGKFEEAAAFRERAFEAAPATAGRLDGTPFQWIADGDSRLGPMLEAIINGRYYWIPWQRLREVRIEKPTDLRDLVWVPAHLTLANGGQTVAFVPSRYPGSERAADTRLVMARATEWEEKSGGLFFGVGQRQFATDAAEYPLLEVGVIELDTVASEADETIEGEPAPVATNHAEQ